MYSVQSIVLGGGAKRVNLVNFFLQVDSISIKGTYPGYKNKKPRKMRFNPQHLTLSFWKCLQVLKNFSKAQKKLFLKCPEKNSVQIFFFLIF